MAPIAQQRSSGAVSRDVKGNRAMRYSSVGMWTAASRPAWQSSARMRASNLSCLILAAPMALVRPVPRSIEGGFLVREPIPHGASPAPRRPVRRCRQADGQADGNRRHVLSEAVPRRRRSLPHGGRTKVVVS